MRERPASSFRHVLAALVICWRRDGAGSRVDGEDVQIFLSNYAADTRESASYSQERDGFHAILSRAARYLLEAERDNGTEVDRKKAQQRADVELARAEASLTHVAQGEAQNGTVTLARNEPSSWGLWRPVSKFLEGLHIWKSVPTQEDVDLVRGWAAELAKTNEVAATLGTFSESISASTVNPAKVLRNISRLLSDAMVTRDQDQQLYLGLLENHFFKRGELAGSNQFDNFEELAMDYKELDEWRRNHSAAREASLKPSRLGSSMANYFVGLDMMVQWQKPLAVVFTCSFGGGHRSAAEAVKHYLDAAGYDVLIIDTTRNKAFLSLTHELSDFFFNRVILANGWHQLFNLIDRWIQNTNGILVQPCPAPACNNARKDQFRSSLTRLRPSLIVTVYHMELMPVLELAKELGNLPLLHMGTDMDLKMREVFRVQPVYPKFKVGIPFSFEASWKTLAPLSASQAFLSGYPVRPAFLAPRNDTLILHERRNRYPAQTRLVLIMSGLNGHERPWPQVLADNGLMNQPTHVIVIAGANDNLEAQLQDSLKGRVSFLQDGGGSAITNRTFLRGESTEVTVEVAKDPSASKEEPYFVSDTELALLMDMADLVITKPGGGSTAEAAYRGVPIVFDSSDMLRWEGFTVDGFVNASQGVKLTDTTSTALVEACQEALRLGQHRAIAADPVTHVKIDSAQRVRQAVTEVRAVACDRCSVFPSAEPDF